MCLVLKVLNGTATITSIAGGVGPYSIVWSTGSTDTSITGLTAGTHTATVMDANGCSVLVSAR